MSTQLVLIFKGSTRGPGIIVFPEDDIESANVVISHANTTTATSTSYADGNFISNIEIDQFGHITGFYSNNVIDFASRLETARSVNLDGVISGNTVFDGSGDVTISTFIYRFHNRQYKPDPR